MFEYLVVGSGCAGSMAAQTLVEANKKVVMVDAGVTGKDYEKLIPKKDFLTIRRTEKDQYKYFLGEDFEGLSWGKVGKGEQITPPRKFINNLVDELLPMESDNFSPYESLAYGGLGSGWGLQCWTYSDKDLETAGLDPNLMHQAYDTVAKRIGISATRDDAARYTLGRLKNIQPSPAMDRNHRLIYQRYLAKKKRLNRRGIFIGRTPLAMLTSAKDDRQKYGYRDLDFYSNKGWSSWRPQYTIDRLKKKTNFDYRGGLLALSFEEKADHTLLECLEIESGQKVSFKCRRLILATGALGTARLVLRSLRPKGQLPLLSNPYLYVPCLQPSIVGKAAESKKLGYGQLSIFLDENRTNFGLSVASSYSYQSLMLFRIIRQAPIDFANARILMQYLMSGFVILGIHHPDKISADKYIKLKADHASPSGDKAVMNYSLGEAEQVEMLRREKKIIRSMRGMGTFALKKINPGFGAGIHYAGTIPFSRDEKELTVAHDGRLHGTRHVYVADSSGFNYLPARGLTFSLLANAHNVAERLARD